MSSQILATCCKYLRRRACEYCRKLWLLAWQDYSSHFSKDEYLFIRALYSGGAQEPEVHISKKIRSERVWHYFRNYCQKRTIILKAKSVHSLYYTGTEKLGAHVDF